MVPDEGLVAENAGLTEWPVPLLGAFDPAFLEVPREVIQLTMRTNQKYFACVDGAGALAPAFVCTANVDAHDGGASIVAGNQKVLAARLSDAKFFWEQDLKVPLADWAGKLDRIVFHEKLGTVADKVERVAKLARWLVEEGIVKPTPLQGRGLGVGQSGEVAPDLPRIPHTPALSPEGEREERVALADMAEQAARLCKGDLVTGMVGEFPELQGVMGGYYARAEGLRDAVADAIRDHYKPVGQGDEVPTAPVTVAVSLADKLDTIAVFFCIDERPTGSKDPYAIRRATLSLIQLLIQNELRIALTETIGQAVTLLFNQLDLEHQRIASQSNASSTQLEITGWIFQEVLKYRDEGVEPLASFHRPNDVMPSKFDVRPMFDAEFAGSLPAALVSFFADRLKVQQREAGVRHDLIDAVFALGGEDDLVRLLARVHALQAFVATDDGANLLAGYKRAANILKKENWSITPPAILSDAGEQGIAQTGEEDPLVMVEDPDFAEAVAALDARMADARLSYVPEPAEAALIAALDAAEPRAADAVATEDFAGAMAALSSLRGPIDAFFETVTVNDPDRDKRAARLALLDRIRGAVHNVADFSKIEG